MRVSAAGPVLVRAYGNSALTLRLRFGRFEAAGGQVFPEGYDPPSNQCLHSAERLPDALRNLAMREPVDEVQVEQFALAFGELIKCACEDAAVIPLGKVLIGVSGDLRLGGIIEADGIPLHPAAADAEVVDGAVPGHGNHPGV